MRIQSVHLNTLLSPWVPQKTKSGETLLELFVHMEMGQQKNKQTSKAIQPTSQFTTTTPPLKDIYVLGIRSKIKTKQNKTNICFFPQKVSIHKYLNFSAFNGQNSPRKEANISSKYQGLPWIVLTLNASLFILRW